jgi:hypothetical protein
VVLAVLSQGQILLLVLLALAGAVASGIAWLTDNGGDGFWKDPDL